MASKRHFYNGVDYDVDLENKKVVLKPEFHAKLKNKALWGRFGFKKITGSTISNIVNKGSYDDPFDAWCGLVRLGLPFEDNKYTLAGQVIEPKFVELLTQKLAHQQKMVKHIIAKDVDYDYFKDQDWFGGVPDGLIGTSEETILLEIKTTGIKNKSQWEVEIPENYKAQTYLYARLLGLEKIVFAVAFLEDKDYIKPEEFVFTRDNVKFKAIPFDKEASDWHMNLSKEFLKDHIQTGVSPQWTAKTRTELLDFLLCKNQEEDLAWQKKYNKT